MRNLPFVAVCLGLASAGLARAQVDDSSMTFAVRGEDHTGAELRGRVRVTDLGRERVRLEYVAPHPRPLPGTLAGVGVRRGREVRVELPGAVGLAGAVAQVEEAPPPVRIRFAWDPEQGGRVQVRRGERLVSDAEGVILEPGAALEDEADPERLGSQARPSLPEERAATQYSRFRGVPFVQGSGDARSIFPNDPEQGGLGDCYLVAALIALAKTDPDVIEDAITVKAPGRFEVYLYDVGLFDGDERVDVDDFFPTAGASSVPAFAQLADRETVDGQVRYELWPMIVEKAWAEYHGGYEDIEGGRPTALFSALSGESTSTWTTYWNGEAELLRVLREKTRAGNPVAVAAKDDQPKTAGRLGVVGDHAYVVWAVEGDRVRLYNPWQGRHPSRALTMAELRSMFSRVYVGNF